MNIMPTERLDMKTALPIFAFFALIFFFSEHYLYYSRLENFDLSADVVETFALEGQLQRRIAFVALALFAITGLLARVRQSLKLRGALGWMLAFFVLWSIMSISWSIDPGVTLRRLGVFVIICLSAIATVRLFPISFLPSCAFFVTASYLLVGLIVEVSLGTFSPLSEGYRFAGTLHPNIQGTNCAMMLLSAIALAGSVKRRRAVFILAACVAFLALILTKSRTAFAATLFALTAFKGLSASKSKYAVVILSVVWVFCLSYILWGEDLIAAFEKWLFMGRGSEGLDTLAGRIQIWERSLNYIAQRPLHGYGFSSFWVPRHIREFSEAVGIGINGAHSVYLDLLLNVGLVGSITYVLILCLGIKDALSYYKKTDAAGYGFLLMLLVFSAVHGVLEGEVIQMSFVTLLLICGFLHLAARVPDNRTPDEVYWTTLPKGKEAI
jgi:exopolysaccharide production protein ExoQ